MSQEKNKKSFLRRLLMLGLPMLVAAVALTAYVLSGRYVSTDNAYVKADKIMLAAEVSGTVMSVNAVDNQIVHKGDVLLTIDPQAYRIAVVKAEANLAAMETEIEEIRASYRQKREELKIAQVEADYAVREYDRQMKLGEEATPRARIDAALRDRDAAATKVLQLEQEAQVILARLANNADIATADHPLYRQAMAELDAARLNLQRTEVRAPVTGVVGTMPRLGAYALAATPVLSLVASQDVWIEANFKETELTDITPGQRVHINIDTYPGYAWDGEVESISPATGSEFSILPAQNATGNWVKVVQRIAVRIRPLPREGAPVLRTGMSADIQVDTRRYPHLPFMKVKG